MINLVSEMLPDRRLVIKYIIIFLCKGIRIVKKCYIAQTVHSEANFIEFNAAHSRVSIELLRLKASHAS